MLSVKFHQVNSAKTANLSPTYFRMIYTSQVSTAHQAHSAVVPCSQGRNKYDIQLLSLFSVGNWGLFLLVETQHGFPPL